LKHCIEARVLKTEQFVQIVVEKTGITQVFKIIGYIDITVLGKTNITIIEIDPVHKPDVLEFGCQVIEKTIYIGVIVYRMDIFVIG